MRTRLKKYTDYGMTREEARQIIRFCRARDFLHRDLVVAAAQKANPQLEAYLVKNICDKIGWVESGAPIDERSFYGWRKKCLYILRDEFHKRGIF